MPIVSAMFSLKLVESVDAQADVVVLLYCFLVRDLQWTVRSVVKALVVTFEAETMETPIVSNNPVPCAFWIGSTE